MQNKIDDHHAFLLLRFTYSHTSSLFGCTVLTKGKLPHSSDSVKVWKYSGKHTEASSKKILFFVLISILYTIGGIIQYRKQGVKEARILSNRKFCRVCLGQDRPCLPCSYLQKSKVALPFVQKIDCE